jgi:ankyrin repeat protein
MRRKRATLLTLVLLIGLIVVPVVLTWRQVRQEQLNHALIATVDRNDATGVRRLLRQGANSNAQVPLDDTRSVWKRLWEQLQLHSTPLLFEGTPLQRAVGLDDTDNANVDKDDIVAALAQAGANVNVRNDRWGTPLTIAASLGRLKTSRILVAYGADASVVWPDQDSPLIVAARSADIQFIITLLHRGARINDREQHGQTALIAAICQFDRNNAGPIRDTVACLLRGGALVNIKDRYGQTPMSLARLFRDKQLLQMLQQAGAK